MSRALPVSCRELDLATVEAELVKYRCNVVATARALGVPASDLRRLVSWGPLATAVSEQVEQAIDRAEGMLREGLELARPHGAAQGCDGAFDAEPGWAAAGLWGKSALLNFTSSTVPMEDVPCDGSIPDKRLARSNYGRARFTDSARV